MLFHVTPCATKNRISNSRGIDTISPRLSRIESVGRVFGQLAQTFYRHIVQLCLRRLTAMMSDNHSSFADHILCIIAIRPQEQMRGIAASRVVTGVTDNHSVRNRALDEHPCDSVGRDRFAMNPKLSISRRNRTGLPFPAGGKVATRFHLLPESLYVTWCKIRVHSDRLLHRLIGVPCLGLFHQRRGFLRVSIIPISARLWAFWR